MFQKEGSNAKGMAQVKINKNTKLRWKIKKKKRSPLLSENFKDILLAAVSCVNTRCEINLN